MVQVGQWTLDQDDSGRIVVRLAGEGRAHNEAGATVIVVSPGEAADFVSALSQFNAGAQTQPGG